MDKTTRNGDILPSQEAILAALAATRTPDRLLYALVAPATATCLRCGRTKDAHQPRVLACPPITSAERLQAMLSGDSLRTPGGIFEAPAEED
jgi:hypothetical protein